MIDRASDAAIEARLVDYLTAERRRAEADYPQLLLLRRRPRAAAGSLGLLVLAAVVLAVVAMARPWGGILPATPGADPVGPDGIPLSIDGQRVLRGDAIDARLGEGGSFLAGGLLVLDLETCDPPEPAPSPACAEDWRLEDAAGEHSVRLMTIAGSAAFVRTSGAPTVFRASPAAASTYCGPACQGTLLVEATVWRQPTKGRIPEDATPPEGGDTNLALVPDFVGAWGGPTGETIVGYIPKDLLFNPRTEPGGTPENPPQDVPMPVYGEDLTTLVGHMVAGQGFVPLGSSPAVPAPAPSVAIGSPSAGPSADPWGPLAVADDASRDTLDAGTGPGRLIIGPRCVTFQPAGADQPTTLIWRSGQTQWDGVTGQIVFADPSAGEIRLSDGQRISFGGAALTPTDAPDQGGAQPTWLRPPDPSCPASQWFAQSVDVDE